MDAEDVVLGIVDACGGEVAEGRTYLQKVAYFVASSMNLAMGFRPHYYGPYSPVIAAEIDSQVEMGRLEEERIRLGQVTGSSPFERIRYSYKLTDSGAEYVRLVRQLDQEGFDTLRDTVAKIQSTGADYRQLSCAAKLYYLLEEAGGRISLSKAKEEANTVGWSMTATDLSTAIAVLQQLELAE